MLFLISLSIPLEIIRFESLNRIRVSLFTFYIRRFNLSIIILRLNIMHIHIRTISILDFIFLNLSSLSSLKTFVLVIQIYR